jgi:shikimate kinase
MIENVVISTGGGAPCFFDNMSYMNQTGTTVYLKISSGELVKRLELVKHTRPVLKGLSGEKLNQFVTDNLGKRDPWYRQASVIFDAEKMLTDHDVNEITCALKKLLS